MVAASQKLLSLVGVANLATRAASSRPTGVEETGGRGGLVCGGRGIIERLLNK